MEEGGSPEAGSAAGPRLHCAHYAWQAGAREGDPSAAGILGAKLVARIREETLHFVPGDDLKKKKKWGRSEDFKPKFQGSKI